MVEPNSLENNQAQPHTGSYYAASVNHQTDYPILRGEHSADVCVIGFKLTDTEDLEQRYAAVKKQFDDSGVDAVVHNDLAEISAKAHPFCLHTPKQATVTCQDDEVLAKTINNLAEMV